MHNAYMFPQLAIILEVVKRYFDNKGVDLHIGQQVSECVTKYFEDLQHHEKAKPAWPNDPREKKTAQLLLSEIMSRRAATFKMHKEAIKRNFPPDKIIKSPEQEPLPRPQRLMPVKKFSGGRKTRARYRVKMR